VESTQADFLVG